MEQTVYKHSDIMQMFRCGVNKAYALMREIKSVSDITHNNRTVHRIDVELWERSKYDGSAKES